MKKITIGILAHVDAGKTTLSESILYASKVIRRLGRVDHGNSFFDTNLIERDRGITVFSKEAHFKAGNTSVTIVDTPGHVDFSAEAERTLQILDYALLLISAPAGIQNHTETIWQLLARYKIPTFVFVNKMDICTSSKENILYDLRRVLSQGLIDFSTADPSQLGEELAMANEMLLEEYTENGTVSDESVRRAINERTVFPVYFGSALKNIGTDALLTALDRFTESPPARDCFGAKVFKITRDERNQRLTHIKITGGRLNVRDVVNYLPRAASANISEKISQIRFYNGNKFENAEFATAGDVCAVTGLSASYSSLGLGSESDSPPAILEPVLSCRVLLPKTVDARTMLPKMKILEEEFPELSVVYSERSGGINVQLMGEIQTETLKRVIQERFDIDVEFDDGEILYKESILAPSEGIGHFEPLRHYAEVHLKLEPLPRGEGLIFESDCSDKILSPAFQRLILTHLSEKQHLGVLTGSPITDVKISLIAGRAHVKHTEGGDFREATYRAVRHGLMRAKSVLLEPMYAFRLEVPTNEIGRAITDIRNMGGKFDSPVENEGVSVLAGRAPVSKMRNYISDVISYTRGKGRLACTLDGYDVCDDADKIIKDRAYDPEADLANTPDSVFCAKGAGFTVKWYDVESYMDVDSGWDADNASNSAHEARLIDRSDSSEDAELEAIMQREFGPIRRRVYSEKKIIRPQTELKIKPSKTKYFIIDGYNVINSWEGLKAAAYIDLEKSRELLTDIIINYSAFTKNRCMIVFDAYKVNGSVGHRETISDVAVAYTKEGETADAYIEKFIREIGRNYDVHVVTSDALIQISALSAGILRMSSTEFESEVEKTNSAISEFLKKLKETPKTKLSSLIDGIRPDMFS